MVRQRAGSEIAAWGPRGARAGLRDLHAALADAIAAIREDDGSVPTVRGVAQRLGVDHDLVLLALGTAPRHAHAPDPTH